MRKCILPRLGEKSPNTTQTAYSLLLSHLHHRHHHDNAESSMTGTAIIRPHTLLRGLTLFLLMLPGFLLHLRDLQQTIPDDEYGEALVVVSTRSVPCSTPTLWWKARMWASLWGPFIGEDAYRATVVGWSMMRRRKKEEGKETKKRRGGGRKEKYGQRKKRKRGKAKRGKKKKEGKKGLDRRVTFPRTEPTSYTSFIARLIITCTLFPWDKSLVITRFIIFLPISSWFTRLTLFFSYLFSSSSSPFYRELNKCRWFSFFVALHLNQGMHIMNRTGTNIFISIHCSLHLLSR